MTIPSPILTKLANKTVYLAGRFDRGVKERLTELVEAQQGKLAVILDARTHYLVLADLAAGKTVQKEAATLNAKTNAAIHVLDADAFQKMSQPTLDELLQLMRSGSANAERFNKVTGSARNSTSAPFMVAGESFEGADLQGFRFDCMVFTSCTFIGADVRKATFTACNDCDFSGAEAELSRFSNIDNSRFHTAKLKGAIFQASIAGADFTEAILDESKWFRYLHMPSASSQVSTPRCNFTRASLCNVRMENMSLASPVLEGANLAHATFNLCWFDSANLRNANLTGASLVSCTFPKADLRGANCQFANFAEADFSDANFEDADLADCNLRGVKLGNTDLSKAKNHNPIPHAATVGAALAELDSLAKSSRRILVTFFVRTDPADEGVEVGVDSVSLAYGWGIRLSHAIPGIRAARKANRSFSDAMITLANMVANRKVRYETVKIESTKSPKAGKELRQVAMNAIAEAFAQPIPPDDQLAAAIKEYRDQLKEKSAVDRERREAAKKLAAKQQATAKRQIAVKIAKTVGAVTDIGTFLKALELRADKSKIDKATKMLKAEKFQLFKDITDTHLNGVVKSQTDADLVYACRIEPGGKYACCTQNLNICGGLRGSICKHLLVLIIGLVKSGELDPSTIDGWIAKTHDAKPELDKEIMGEIFIRYKGAEAGEVDWRPTETVPEDYYAV